MIPQGSSSNPPTGRNHGDLADPRDGEPESGRAWEGGLINHPKPEHVPECEAMPDTQQTREKKTVRVKIFKFGQNS